jgi:hypothetical protein
MRTLRKLDSLVRGVVGRPTLCNLPLRHQCVILSGAACMNETTTTGVKTVLLSTKAVKHNKPTHKGPRTKATQRF